MNRKNWYPTKKIKWFDGSYPPTIMMYGNQELNHRVIGMHHYLIGRENERNQLENINKNRLNNLSFFCIHFFLCFVTLRRPLGVHIFIGLSKMENQRRGTKWMNRLYTNIVHILFIHIYNRTETSSIEIEISLTLQVSHICFLLILIRSLSSAMFQCTKSLT